MGAACTSDKYRQIREEYGLELTKMVIGEKNKLFLDRIIGKLKQEIQEYARKAEANAHISLDNAEANIKQFYGRVREELDQRQPGGVKSLEQMSGATAEELLGYAFVRGLLGELRASVETRFKEE
jgi:F0F1-type ATP synthase membrane subunit b/b'